MNAILQTLLDPILPVFAILALGAVLARRGLFDVPAAQTINRFVFYVGVPALLFALLIDAPLRDFEWPVLGLYLLSELVVYALGFMLALFAFRRPPREAILLGMAAGFVNHVFFVLPMGTVIYGERAALPIAAIITMDSVLIFTLAIVWLELSTRDTGSASSAAKVILRNPMLLAIAAGVAVNLSGVPVHAGIVTFVDFAGAAAAPIALFALGIILAHARADRVDGAAMATAGVKVLVHPLLAWMLLATGSVAQSDWLDPALLVSAGPCGAMPFVLALQYGINAHSLAKAIVYSTLASLLTLAVIA